MKEQHWSKELSETGLVVCTLERCFTFLQNFHLRDISIWFSCVVSALTFLCTLFPETNVDFWSTASGIFQADSIFMYILLWLRWKTHRLCSGEDGKISIFRYIAT